MIVEFSEKIMTDVVVSFIQMDEEVFTKTFLAENGKGVMMSIEDNTGLLIEASYVDVKDDPTRQELVETEVHVFGMAGAHINIKPLHRTGITELPEEREKSASSEEDDLTDITADDFDSDGEDPDETTYRPKTYDTAHLPEGDYPSTVATGERAVATGHNTGVITTGDNAHVA
jgi:hypothetical protein